MHLAFGVEGDEIYDSPQYLGEVVPQSLTSSLESDLSHRQVLPLR